jgi:hypothetical protein
VPLIAICKGLSLTTCWGSNCTHTWPCLRDHTELGKNFEVALKKKKKWESHALMLQLLLAEHNDEVIMSYGDF